MDPEELWNNIVDNQGAVIETITGIELSYEILPNDMVHWVPLEPNLQNPWDQTRQQIIDCIEVRENGLGPTQWPGMATSYKWALLNNVLIWPD